MNARKKLLETECGGIDTPDSGETLSASNWADLYSGALTADDCLAKWRAAHPITGKCRECETDLTDNAVICGDCDRVEQARVRTQRVALYAARQSIPKSFVWCEAGYDGPDALARIFDKGAVAKVKGAGPAQSITIRGLSGSGKTSLACLRAFDLANGGMSPVFVAAHKLALARSQSKLGDEAEVVADALGADALVLDELGSEPHDAKSALAQVIYERHAAEKPTIVTTWLTVEQIGEKYGDGIARRLLERTLAIELKARPKAVK